MEKKLVLHFFMVILICKTNAFFGIGDGIPDSNFIPRELEINVEGWHHETPRNLSLYIHPEKITTVSSPNNLCSPSSYPYLLIIVTSRLSDLKERNFIRKTWASEKYLSSLSEEVKVAFLLGQNEYKIPNLLISNEIEKYGDIIQESFHDTYNNLTIKSAMMLKWVKTHCTGMKYLMKTDDDMIINIKNLLKILTKKPIGSSLLFGHLNRKNIPHLSTTSKSYAPKYLYPHSVYPKYLSGWGYVMSTDVAIKLYEAALTIPVFHVEDVFITGICAKKVNIQPINHPGFLKFSPQNDRQYENLIVSHGLKNIKNLRAWKKLNQE